MVNLHIALFMYITSWLRLNFAVNANFQCILGSFPAHIILIITRDIRKTVNKGFPDNKYTHIYI